MKPGTRVLIEEDHGNILWFATVTEVDHGGGMIEVLYESGPLEGVHQWREAWEISVYGDLHLTQVTGEFAGQGAESLVVWSGRGGSIGSEILDQSLYRGVEDD